MDMAKMDPTTSVKSFKKPFAVPGNNSKEGKEKNKKDNTSGNSGEQADPQKSSEYLMKENGTPQAANDPAKKKVKKLKTGGFTAPTPKREGHNCESSGNQTVTESQEKKKRKKFKVDKSADDSKDAQKPEKKNVINEHEVPVSALSVCLLDEDNNSNDTKTKKRKESCKVIKPIRSLTDEEYDKIFECALSRVLKLQTDDTVQSISDSRKEDGAHSDLENLTLKMLDDVESIDNTVRGDVQEENLPLNEDYHQEIPDDSESPELIQHENEVTPAVSESEAPNITKPAFVPVKTKKPVRGKKKFHPKNLGLGQIESKKEKKFFVTKKCLKSKSKKRKEKLTKQTEMLNRDIEELGTWVQCINPDCMKWRYIQDVSDPSVLPDQWTCSMNSEELYNSCDKPEEDFDESVHVETFIYTHFVEGSVVWAKMIGYPWWPAMVEIDPDIGEYFDSEPSDPMLPTHYHVVFFDNKVSRAWIATNSVKSFIQGNEPCLSVKIGTKSHCHKKEIDAAKKNAEEALTYSLKERLRKFSFSARFKGTWGLVSDDEVLNGVNISQGYENQLLAKTKWQHPKVKEEDLNTTSLELDLHGTIVDDILDNAESILSNADKLCSIEDTFVESEDGPDIQPQLNKECKKRKISERVKVTARTLKKCTKEKGHSKRGKSCGDHVSENHEGEAPVLEEGAGDASKSCIKSEEGVSVKKRKQKPDESIKIEGKVSKCVLKTKKKKFKAVGPIHEESGFFKAEKKHADHQPEYADEHDEVITHKDSQLEEKQSLLHVKKPAAKKGKAGKLAIREDKNIPSGPVKKEKKKQLACSKTGICSYGSSNDDFIDINGKEEPACNMLYPAKRDGNLPEESDQELAEDAQSGKLQSCHSQFSKGQQKNHKVLSSSHSENSDPFEGDDEVDLSFPCKDQPLSKTQENSDPFEACEE